MVQQESGGFWSRLGAGLATGLALGAGVGCLAGLAVGVDCLFKNPAIRGARDVLLTLAWFALLFAVLCLCVGLVAGLGCQLWALLRPRVARGERPACLGVLVAALAFAELWDRSYTAQGLVRAHQMSLVTPAESWLHLGALSAAALAAGWLAARTARRLFGHAGAGRWLLAGAGVAAALVGSLALRPSPAFDPPAYTPDMRRESALRVRLVVVDGADWRVIRPLVEAGRMPHLAGLIERGVSAELGVTFPSESPHMWTALSTGVEDSVNGLCEFYAYRPPGTHALITRYPGLGDSRRLLFRQGILWLHRFGLGSVHFATSAQKAVPELWDYLGEAGMTVAVVGWRFSAPAEPVHGFLLTDEFSPGAELARDLFPFERADLVAADNAAEVEAQVASFGDFVAHDPAQAGRVETHLDGLRLNLARDLLYLRTALRVQAELAPDFLAVAQRSIDGIEHSNMLKHALARRPAGEPVPRHLESALVREGRVLGADVVAQAYALLDQELGELLDGLGDDVVLVVSDHGHDFDGSGHQFGPPGIIVIAGGPITPGAELDSPTVFDVAPSVLHLMGLPVPEGLAGRVLEEALDPAWSRANPVVHVSGGSGSTPLGSLGPPVAPIEREHVEELRELGYVE